MHDKIIERISKLYRIDPAWVEAIVQTESAGNPLALRYEPDYSYVLTPTRFVGVNNSLATEIATQKMSWGLGQIMGGLAREQGHKGLMSELLEPELNIKHVCMRLKTLERYSSDLPGLISSYNGGPGILKGFVDGKYPNQSYVDKVMKNLA